MTIIKNQIIPEAKGSHKKIKIECDNCRDVFEREFRYCVKQREKINKDLCWLCATRENNASEEHRQKLIATVPRGENHSNFGNGNPGASRWMKENNPMNRQEVRNKVSKWRKNMPQEIRDKYSKGVSKAWVDGKFDGVAVGQCKWYSYIKKDGTTIKLQGTWELAFAEWADNKGLKFKTHKGRIPYVFKGENRNYYPDFYVEDWNCYVDIKNKYHMSLQENKFKAIRESNPNLHIKILLKKDLEELEVL